MAKRLYSEVVSGDESNQESSFTASTKSIVNWLKDYQEDEHIALEKALNLSKDCKVYTK
jgi:cell division inhibitor SulA